MSDRSFTPGQKTWGWVSVVIVLIALLAIILNPIQAGVDIRLIPDIIFGLIWALVSAVFAGVLCMKMFYPGKRDINMRIQTVLKILGALALLGLVSGQILTFLLLTLFLPASVVLGNVELVKS